MQLEKIYYINLEKDCERRVLLEHRIKKYFPGVHFERIKAVSPETLHDHKDFFEDRLTDRVKSMDGQYPYPGTIGCFLSHYLALKTIEKNCRTTNAGNKRYLVLEDDCVFDKTVFPIIKNRIDSHLPEQWKIVKHSLGERNDKDLVNESFLDISAARNKSWEYYCGTHFMIYNEHTIHEIIAMMESLPIYCFDKWVRNHVDSVYSFAKHLHIKQSNLGGSNTNPDFSGSGHEDRRFRFDNPNSLSRTIKSRLLNALTR